MISSAAMTALQSYADPASGVIAASALFRGLSDPTRLSILLALLDGERRAVDLVRQIGYSQANISQHLACLRGCGLITGRPQGRAVFYSVAHPEVIDVLRSAEALLERTGTTVTLCPTYGTDAP